MHLYYCLLAVYQLLTLSGRKTNQVWVNSGDFKKRVHFRPARRPSLWAADAKRVAERYLPVNKL